MQHRLKKPRLMIAAAVCLLAAVLVNVLGYVIDCRYISVFAAAQDADKYEIRSRLLAEAMEDLGVCSAEDAALVWAKGLKMRSAALQYSVMNERLKKEYALKLEKSAPNWVTGVSSPWVQRYKVVDIKEIDNGRKVIKLVISTETSTGSAGEYVALLTIALEGDFWRIEDIKADNALSPYMGVDS